MRLCAHDVCGLGLDHGMDHNLWSGEGADGRRGEVTVAQRMMVVQAASQLLLGLLGLALTLQALCAPTHPPCARP